jgi:predicted transcriptional regulator of viral defense system
MARRGSLRSVGNHRWVVLPAGASTIEQAAPLKVLLAAKFDGRADWYLGYLSALADHRLTDIDPEDVYVGVRRARMPTEQRLGSRRLIVVRHDRDDDWRGVEQQREGRVMTYRSDVERTLLDTLDQPRRCGPPEVWVRAWERAMREQRADPLVLSDYAEQRSDAVQARLAFWLRETGHVRQARRVQRAIGKPATGRVFLDASRAFGDGPWRRDRDTGLVVNLPERALDGWLEYSK